MTTAEIEKPSQSLGAALGGLMAFAADVGALSSIIASFGQSHQPDRGVFIGGAASLSCVALVLMVSVSTLANKPAKLIGLLRGVWWLTWMTLLASAIMMFFEPQLGL